MSYIYVVQMNIPAQHEADFNRWYDREHLADQLAVFRPRVEAVGGAMGAAETFALADEIQQVGLLLIG